MKVVVVTGSAGLIGAEATRYFANEGFYVVGIDNDMRSQLFGPDASTLWSRQKLEQCIHSYRHYAVDIRSEACVEGVFQEYGSDIKAVIHTAAQPSHDWAVRDPQMDFGINANGTLNLLEATRRHCHNAVFMFTSTNKVYGDTPNRLPMVELDTRWEADPATPYGASGIDESMSIDQSTHSLFGTSKTAADLLVQEYGRYFGMRTGCFRGGCLTGSGHAGTELHGFLAYLMFCARSGRHYTVFGYKGKQVRDNIHSADLVSMLWHYYQAPRVGEVYNVGGGRYSHCSILEAIKMCEEITGKTLSVSYIEENRIGDHIWYISDIRKFRKHYPTWQFRYTLQETLVEIHDGLRQREATRSHP